MDSSRHAPSSQTTPPSQQPEQEQPAQPAQQQKPLNNRQLISAGRSMALATLISRITGFLRSVFVAAALGGTVSSAYNTANTLPNLVTELVLGAVLTSLVVPVLVRAEKEDPDRGEAFIRRLLTTTFTLTIVVTLIAVAATPLLIRLGLDSDGQVNVTMATAFGYLLLPQILFYGLFSVFMAVLNTKEVFRPGAWAPVLNNVVTLAVFGLYIFIPDDAKLQPTDNVTITNPHILLLGLGTTAGVVIQALVMVPYLRKAGINIRPLWGIDARLKSFGGMAIAIIVYVAISQLGWNINNRIASEAWGAAPTVYMQAWQLLQMPYGVVGVTLLTAVMPRLSRNAADGDDRAVVNDLTIATKLTMLAMIPVILFYTAFGDLIAKSLFAYRQFTLDDAAILGLTVSFSAFTLIPYAVVLLHLRVFYAREEVWTPTFIIAGITITKLALALLAPMIARSPETVVVILGAANGCGFIAGAVIGDRLLRRSLGSLNFFQILHTCLWTTGAAAIGVAAAWGMNALLIATVVPQGTNPWLLLRLIIVGIVFLAVTAVVLVRVPLPEAAMLATQFRRVPVVGRFLAPASVQTDSDAPAAAAMEPAAPTPGRLELGVQDSTAAEGLPVVELPPLIGVVQTQRLIPGAQVLQGRYRLMVGHGSTPAAKFWQAFDRQTGATVAITVVDPDAWLRWQATLAGTAFTADTEEFEAAKTAILRSAAAVKLEGPEGVAPVFRVIDNGELVFIVSDWVASTALSKRLGEEMSPEEADAAVAQLRAGTAALDGGTVGVDNIHRLRVDAEGSIFVAFPGALPDATAESERLAIDAAVAPEQDEPLGTGGDQQLAFTAARPLDLSGAPEDDVTMNGAKTVPSRKRMWADLLGDTAFAVTVMFGLLATFAALVVGLIAR